jgi:cation:H+ antiporter
MLNRLRHPLAAVAFAVGLTVPWVLVWGTGSAHGLGELAVVSLSGLGILGASFLLAWGAETAEKDVPRAFAIAVLAVLAVAPEYAVDALYAWTAGAAAGTPRGVEAGNLAIANMTGANRILIGLGWSGIALFSIYRNRSEDDAAIEERDGLLADVVHLDRDITLEITFLLAATVYAFFVPLAGGIDVIDTVVLVGLYALYIAVILRGDVEEVEGQVGVPAYFHGYRKRNRALVSLLLFAYSGALIYIAVHDFAHGLESLGQAMGIPSFFMIQWIAPLASESPELIVVAYLVNKARSTAGFNALVSSKLNQWTLLIGTLAVVYSIALGSVGTLSFDAKQAAEIWITAGQSFFAIAVLVNFTISGREAVVLLGLFASQVLLEFAIIREYVVLPFTSYDVLIGYAVVYIALGAVLFARRRGEVWRILTSTGTRMREAFGLGGSAPEHAD